MTSARTKWPFLLTVVTIISLPAFAQQAMIDSLRERLNHEQLSDTARINTWNRISAAYLASQNKDGAYYYATLSLKESKKTNYALGELNAYFNLGETELFLGTNSRAEKYLLHAAAICKTLGTSHRLLQALCYKDLGLSLWAQSKFDSAAIAYRTAEALALRLNHWKILSGIYVPLSALESQRGDYKSSINYAMRGLPLWKDPRTFNSGGSAAIAFIYNSFGDYESSLQYYREAVRMLHERKIYSDRTNDVFMGETYFLAKKYDSARYCYARVLGALKNERDKYWYDSRTAELSMVDGNLDEAITKLTSSYLGFKCIDDNNQTMWVLSRLMRAHEMNHDSPAAMNYAYELLNLSTATGARQHERDANYMLSTLYEQQHNADSAFKYIRQYNYFRDIIDSGQAQQRLAIMKSRFELEKLQDSLEKHESKLQQAAAQRVYLMITILMITAIGIIAFRNVSLRRNSEHQRLTSVQNELLLQKLEGEATKATLQQRATDLEMQALRAQMNPHFIFNSLNSINRYILTNDKKLASEYLTTFSKLIRLILSNSQSPLITLESELEGLSLYLKLESLRFENRFEYHISILDDIEPSELKVPPLILQPYVENAIWHGLMHKAEPGYLDIQLRRKRELLYINITDNGIGRTHAAALSSKSATRNKSLGLKITADRIAHMFGEQSANLTITINDLAHPDGTAAGTEVVVKIPVIYD